MERTLMPVWEVWRLDLQWERLYFSVPRYHYTELTIILSNLNKLTYSHLQRSTSVRSAVGNRMDTLYGTISAGMKWYDHLLVYQSYKASVLHFSMTVLSLLLIEGP